MRWRRWQGGRLRTAIGLVVVWQGLGVWAARTVGAEAVPVAATSASSQASAGTFLDRVLRDEQGEHRYVEWLPPGYTADRAWPVIVFLHGAGERGADGRRMLDVGLGPVLRRQPGLFPAVVVFPQAEDRRESVRDVWRPTSPDGARALRILEAVETERAIDKSRRILIGWSMGAYGCWSLAAGCPEGTWSAVLPISGGGDPRDAAEIPEGASLWAIHGTDDRIVSADEMTAATNAATAAGRPCSSTRIEGAGHDAWRLALRHPDVIRWLFDPGSVRPEDVVWDDAALDAWRREIPKSDAPFVPGTAVTRAVALRIGNDAFQAISAGLPAGVDRENLKGELADLSQEFEYEGQRIVARLTGIRWTMELESVSIAAVAAEDLRIRAGLRRLVLQVGGGEASGAGYRLASGPFRIVIAPWREVPVDVAARPRIVDGKLRLNARDIRFTIPDDNWIIEEPDEVTASGPGLTEEIGRIAIVGGLYRARPQVEEAVRELIPSLIDRIEERLAMTGPDTTSGLLWPLPTSPPAFRIRPEAIRTDREGVSVTARLIAAAPSGESAGGPRTIDAAAPILDRGAGGLAIGIAPSAVATMSESLVRSDEARLNVLDAPDPGFAALAERSLLCSAAPDLARHGAEARFRTEIVLSRPIALESRDGPGDALEIDVRADEALLVTSYQDATAGVWRDCLTTRLQLRQPIRLSLGGSAGEGRIVQVRWGDELDVRGTLEFCSGYAAEDARLDAGPLVGAFERSWRSWTSRQSASPVVDDVEIGAARLRLNGLPSRGGRIWLQFRPTAGAEASSDAGE
ncbi:MAG: hypothetical protein KF774_13970 [Planctomyces sp.]|nr:hypothetical protein [Planctomyces sp.]